MSGSTGDVFASRLTRVFGKEIAKHCLPTSAFEIQKVIDFAISYVVKTNSHKISVIVSALVNFGYRFFYGWSLES